MVNATLERWPSMLAKLVEVVPLGGVLVTRDRHLLSHELHSPSLCLQSQGVSVHKLEHKGESHIAVEVVDNDMAMGVVSAPPSNSSLRGIRTEDVRIRRDGPRRLTLVAITIR